MKSLKDKINEGFFTNIKDDMKSIATNWLNKYVGNDEWGATSSGFHYDEEQNAFIANMKGKDYVRVHCDKNGQGQFEGFINGVKFLSYSGSPITIFILPAVENALVNFPYFDRKDIHIEFDRPRVLQFGVGHIEKAIKELNNFSRIKTLEFNDVFLEDLDELKVPMIDSLTIYESDWNFGPNPILKLNEQMKVKRLTLKFACAMKDHQIEVHSLPAVQNSICFTYQNINSIKNMLINYKPNKNIRNSILFNGTSVNSVGKEVCKNLILGK